MITLGGDWIPLHGLCGSRRDHDLLPAEAVGVVPVGVLQRAALAGNRTGLEDNLEARRIEPADPLRPFDALSIDRSRMPRS